MLSKYLVVNNIGDIHIRYKTNKVLTLISITLFILLFIFSYKLIMNLMFPYLSPLDKEINIILSCCVAANIAACLIIYRYQLVIKEFESRTEIEKSKLNATSKNIKLEVEQRKRLESDLQRSEKECSMLLSLIPMMAFNGYIELPVDFSDDKVEQVTGYKKHDFKSGKIKWSDLIVKDDFNKVKMESMEILSNGKSYVIGYKIRTREGKVIGVQQSTKILCNKEGRIEYLNSFIFDIGGCKQAEKARSQTDCYLVKGTFLGEPAASKL